MADPRAASFGAVAEDYERGRPGWPGRVAEVAELPPGAEVLDLAAGTGKLTRLLLDRFARVVAAEIARVLRPGGALVVCFNEPCGETAPPRPADVWEIVRRYRPPGASIGGRPLVESGAWRKPFAAAPFEELRYEEVVHEHVRDTEADVAAVLSISGLALLSPERRAALREELRAALPDELWRTPLRCEIWWTSRH